MKEQALVSPDQHQLLLDQDDNRAKAERILHYNEIHRQMPRYFEDLEKVEHRIRDKITASVKLPKRH